MKTIVFASQKGGVGRTTVSGNVAASMAASGTQTIWVTTAEGDWAAPDGLTVLGSGSDGLKQAVTDAQAAGKDAVVVDLSTCDKAAGWWSGEAAIVLVADGEAASLYAALETAKRWRDSGVDVQGFVLARVPDDVAPELARRFMKTVAQFANVRLTYFGSIPDSPDSAALVNIGRFCKGKAARCYREMVKRLETGHQPVTAEPDGLQGLRERRDLMRAA